MPARSSYKTYTVVRGDSLSKIAQRFGSSVQAIATASGISDPNKIVVGQGLLIPVKPDAVPALESPGAEELPDIVVRPTSSPKTPPAQAASGSMVSMSLADYIRPWFEPPRLYGTLALLAAAGYYLLAGNRRSRR